MSVGRIEGAQYFMAHVAFCMVVTAADCKRCADGCPLDAGDACPCECHLTDEEPTLGWE